MNTTHTTKTKLLAKAVGVAAAAMFSGGLALAGLGLASGIAQAGPTMCYSEGLQTSYVCGYTPDK